MDLSIPTGPERPEAHVEETRRPDVTWTSKSADVVSVRPTTLTDMPRQIDSNADGLGAVFTRRWAAELVLDLAGYTADKDLATRRAIEPSCGGGAFLVPMIERLAKSCADRGHALEAATEAIRAWDLNEESVNDARAIVRKTLRDHGVNPTKAAALARKWVRQGDFLLSECEPSDWVLGNPPYVRLEDVPTERSAAYRSTWPTMRGRADVYVGFIEAGLRSLRPGGVLAFICADRWMRNQYGRPLRRLIEDTYSVDAVVTLHDSDAFEEKVNAYPAIFTIRAGLQGASLVVDADASFGAAGADSVVEAQRSGPVSNEKPIVGAGFSAAWTTPTYRAAESWPTGEPHRLALVSELEATHPTLTDDANDVRIGIGIATGADAVFLTKDAMSVEPSRRLPLVMAADIGTGSVEWSGTHLVNPWDANGLISLAKYPRTANHFRAHEDKLRARHVGRTQPERWFRTIDRPVAGLLQSPKLLLPDLRHRVAPVLERGGLYPHHNLFWITSSTWDLRVLGGLLLSDFGTLFVETYSPRMAGGALRVTAQYLRRIRIPDPTSLTPATRRKLAMAFDKRDVAAATAAACDAYRIDVSRLHPPA